jgi:fructuronate reductase
MAYAGSLLGHETVADAIADPLVRSWVEEWWDAAAPHVDLPAVDVSGYRQALLDRYRNPQIRHLLAQIAADGSQKVPIRALPVLRAELARGRVAPGATRIVAAWIAHLRGLGAPVTDTAATEVRALAQGDPGSAVESVLEWLGLDDGQRERVAPVVLAQLAHLTRLARATTATASPAGAARE